VDASFVAKKWPKVLDLSLILNRGREDGGDDLC